VQRLSEQTTKEDRVIALAKTGISLSSIFFVVGPKCLSTDEIFKAIQYKKMLEAWEESTKERKRLVDERALHEKARAVESKGTKTKPDYEKLLRWKMGADKFKKEGKGKKLDALNILWNEYKDHAVIPIFHAGGATITTTCSSDFRDGFGASLNKVCEAGHPAQHQEYGQE
jgi:hypothetical protein